MYKFDNGQISLEDFGQPVGMNLKDSNRWVKRAQMIPWIEIEKKYAKLFSNKKGNVAKSLRPGLGARIIQAEYGYSDAEIPLRIQENPYLQYFCGYKAFDDSKPPFDSSMMVYFRKRLTPEIVGEINEMIITAEQAKVVRKFMEMDSLTAPMLRELIDHIDVYEKEGGKKNYTQRIVIYYRFVGYLELPTSEDENYKANTRKGVDVEYIPTAKSA